MLLRAVAVLSACVAAAALVLSAVLLVEVRHQRKEIHQVRGLAIDTAQAVVMQHKTIGLLLTTEENLVRVTRRLRTPRAARTIYVVPTP
jgi:hypothetical protein